MAAGVMGGEPDDPVGGGEGAVGRRLVARLPVVDAVVGLALLVVTDDRGTRLQGLLWGVTPKDPATFATVIATIAVVALVACLVPVYRALQVSPLTAIRHD